MKNINYTLIMLLFPFIISAQIFNTDVFIKGSLCVGTDCVSSETFGLDVQRFKEQNIRLHFDDTSENGSDFPNNDWRILINDNLNGGSNYFAIEDATANNVPFRIEAGAGEKALHVDDDEGNIGMGTDTPGMNLHITSDDSPTIRLEQDNSDGWTPQTWDIGGNEADFFIRDLTAGGDGNSNSIKPFRIKPGASDDAIVVQSNGFVSIGSNATDEKLFVQGGNISLDGDLHFRGGGSDKFRLLHEGSDFVIRSVLNTPSFGTPFDLVKINSAAPENTLIVHESGAISIGSDTENRKLYINGGLTVNGDIQALSDKRLKTDITEMSYGLDDILQLAPKSYNFINEGYEDLNLSQERQLGFIAQEVQQIIPELVTENIEAKSADGELKKLMGINYTSLIPVLVQAIKEQQLESDQQKKEIAYLKTQLGNISNKLDLVLTQFGQNNQERIVIKDDDVISQNLNSDAKVNPSTENAKDSKTHMSDRTRQQIKVRDEKGN